MPQSKTDRVQRAAASTWGRIRALVALSRPFDSVTVGLAVVVGMVVAADGESFPLWKVIAGFAVGYLLLAGTDTINDVVDLDTDTISKPWRPLPAGRVEPRVAAIAAGFEMAAALGIAASLSAGTLVISGVAAAVGIAYSWRLEDVFIVKNAAVAATLILPMAAGGAIITLDWPPLLWSLFPMVFLATLGFEIHKDVLDREADRWRGRRTIPNTLPAPYPQWIIGGCYAGAYGTAWWLTRMDPLGALYGWALVAAGPVLVLGMALLRPRGVRPVARLRASFLATNVAFLIALLGIGIEALLA